jgi:frataxin-like iron-binding protein CyaY
MSGFMATRSGDRLTVDRADSNICITDELLMDVASGQVSGVSVADGVLRVDADNGSFCYRLDSHDPSGRLWLAHRIEEAT